MDLTTYAGLQSAIADFLNRTDLTAQIPGFIALAEARIKREAKLQTVRATLTIDSAHVTLPTAARALHSVKLVSSIPSADAPLDICTPQILADHATYWTSPGRPRYASTNGTELNVVPTPDQSYTAEIVYEPTITPLSNTNTTNAVLADAPDAYLYGALAAAAPFLEHDERAPMWDAAYQQAIKSLNIMRDRQMYAGAPMPLRLPRVF